MAYMKDPRESIIDYDKHAVWEADNRVEARWQWNAMITDFCDMTPEEYMTNPVVEAITSAIGDSSGMTSAITEAANNIIEAINSASTMTNDNIDESTEEIVEAIGGVTPKDERIYYVSLNSQADYNNLTPEDFETASLAVGSSVNIYYYLGDPTPEQYAEYIADPTQEAEKHLREVACNSYYLAVSNKIEKRRIVIMENDISDVSDNFIEVPQSIFEGYKLYRSLDEDYFNEDYPSETEVKQSHKITINK